MTVTVTDQLVHHLVAGSHAEGTTRLAVAAAIEHDDRTLLIAALDDDFQTAWQLPCDLVLPGETLLHGLARTVVVTTSLNLTDVTGYVGRYDRLIDGHVVRTFVFTVTVADPDRICRWANIGHRWTNDPINACNTGDADGYPTSMATLRTRLIRPTPTDQLSASLLENAKGLLCDEAAVELLINQRSWLHRRDFVERFVDTVTPPTTSQQPTCSTDAAFVEWAGALCALDAGQLPCSSGEGQLLRIAASLAAGIPVDLRDAITGLDSTNTRLVARAIFHASGQQP